jgi:hypothetical protein
MGKELNYFAVLRKFAKYLEKKPHLTLYTKINARARGVA